MRRVPGETSWAVGSGGVRINTISFPPPLLFASVPLAFAVSRPRGGRKEFIRTKLPVAAFSSSFLSISLPEYNKKQKKRF